MLELLDRVSATFEGGAQRHCERMKRYRQGDATTKHWSRLLFEHDFPDWIIAHADTKYHFDWDRIVKAISNGDFFMTEHGPLVPESR